MIDLVLYNENQELLNASGFVSVSGNTSFFVGQEMLVRADDSAGLGQNTGSFECLDSSFFGSSDFALIPAHTTYAFCDFLAGHFPAGLRI